MFEAGSVTLEIFECQRPRTPATVVFSMARHPRRRIHQPPCFRARFSLVGVRRDEGYMELVGTTPRPTQSRMEIAIELLSDYVAEACEKVRARPSGAAALSGTDEPASRRARSTCRLT